MLGRAVAHIAKLRANLKGEDVTSLGNKLGDYLGNYLAEIEERKKQNLKPKPIDNSALVAECIDHIKDSASINETNVCGFLYIFGDNFCDSYIEGHGDYNWS